MIWLEALAFLAMVAAPLPAAAKPTFPCALLDGLNQACPAQVSLQPPCSDCHLGGKTGGATPFTAFAWGMRARGMSGSVESVKTAIAQMKIDGVDSDGDGTPDWQEIIDGTDPNEPGTASNIQDPQLGCAVGGRRAAGGIGAALALAALALVRRGRRRR
ncbi:MAG TPA: thrombospondin type 3 repeat-containing protein [Polyangia bacterium]|nr:thrombospondin type 3 repeat-containing protein [Polyangia bacterium]